MTIAYVPPPAQYLLNNFEDGTTIYVGAIANIKAWRVQRFNQTTGVMDYATVLNNPGYPLYSDAWANRLTLTYGQSPT